MTPKEPRTQSIDRTKHTEALALLRGDLTPREFERQCEPIVRDILVKHEGFERVERGPSFTGTPFDYFGFRGGIPHVVEFKGSRRSFPRPGKVQRRRLRRVLEAISGLSVAILQFRADTAEFRIRYGEDALQLLAEHDAPLEPIVAWVKERL